MSGAVREPRARRAAADLPHNDRPCRDRPCRDRPCHDRAHVESGEAATQLRESRRLLAQLERIGGFGSFVFDRLARTLSWSDELYRLHGIGRDDFTDPGAEPLRYVHPDDHERTMAFLATVAANVETSELEYRIIRPDGETRWLVARAQRDCDHPRRVVGTVHDATDRRRAEQALRASEERYQSIAENLPGMVYQFVREADGSMRFPFVSEGSAEIYGLGRALCAAHARLLAERTTALTALADSEERFRSAFARAPLGMFITSLRADDRGRLLRVNPAACAMLGYTEDELHECTFAGISHPDDIARDYDAIPRLISGEWKTYQTQKRYLHRDGHLVWAELHSAAVRDASGDVVSVVTQVRDITDERAAADRLRQQAELLDLTQDAIIVRDLDSRIIFWNGGAETTYGWPSQQACGHVTHRLLRTRRTDGGEMSDVDRTLLTDGRWDGELIHLRADGSSITVASRHVLRRDPDGTPAVILETNTDITGRVAAERALADREQRFRTQFELAPIAQAVAGLDGQIMEVNDAYCALFGRSRSDLLVTNYRDMIHPDDRPAHLARFANLFAGQYDGYQRHKRMLRADGGIVEVNSYLTLVRDAQGRPEAIISQLQDITDRRQAERDRDAAAAQLAERNAQLERSNVDLQAANQLKLDLMGMLSHEIGTPLTAILGHAEIAEEVTDPTQRAHRSLVAIRRNAERLAAMRTEILTMCALDTAQLTAERERVPLADAIAQTLVAVETDIPVIGADDRTALVSPSHLQHILINFLTNAAKYAGGATEVHVSGDDVSVEIRVHDKGPGVPEELRDHLFERFTRGTDSPSRAHGTGLGLYIVRGLAEANSGQVWHEPRHPQGSAFALRLARAGR